MSNEITSKQSAIAPSVTVIIATMLSADRRQSIFKAIRSIQMQDCNSISILVVANGKRVDSSILLEIQSIDRLKVILVNEGSYPKALIMGRQYVKTDFFCFLDDDDELLEGSITQRLYAFQENDVIDVVVGNGLSKNKSLSKLVITQDKFDSFKNSPAESILERRGNWLASCAGMFKTETVGSHYFEDYAEYAEWSYLAIKLANTKKVILIDYPCYQINASESSLSNSERYEIGIYQYLKKLKSLKTTPSFKRKLDKKLVDFEHSLSLYFWHKNEYRKAIKFHLKSLMSFYGFKRYFLSTRHFLVR